MGETIVRALIEAELIEEVEGEERGFMRRYKPTKSGETDLHPTGQRRRLLPPRRLSPPRHPTPAPPPRHSRESGNPPLIAQPNTLTPRIRQALSFRAQ